MSGDVSHLRHHGGAAPHEDPRPGLPRQRRGTTPQGFGRYPDFDVLAQGEHWDEVTRRVVLDRVERVPPIRFFDDREAATLGAFCDTVLAQDREPRVPVLAMVDEKLHERKLDGYRHADMPPDPQTWRVVARKLDEEARRLRAEDFAAASQGIRDEVVRRFAAGELEWEELPVDKAWSVVMRMVLAAFYSHPWAWSEIGFGGPAYPRGFARLGPGQREHWETPPEFEVDPVSDVRERGVD
ncbi:MAG TPA: gluconate 2-dehydrogenase subunit 3 family protein [Solirubrobacterales bacterium]|nr:gluconate 2-dehydrogenase subunit 3 family protein [Solirubrobacterales bacterium]